MRILHLSDTHVSAGGPDMDGVDAVGSLERLLHDVRHVPGLDLVVVSGDVADDGTAAGCDAVRDRVGAFAAARGIPHVYSTGNHDDRAAFRTSLGTGHLGPDGTDRGEPLDPEADTRAAVSWVGGMRIVTLDSLVPGATHGHIDGDQLGLLADLLATPARDGTVLVFHHPPLRLASVPFVEKIALQNSADLAAVVRGADVRAILTGHLHFQLGGYLAGAPVWVTPGVVTRMDATAPPHLARGVLGAGASVVDLADPTAPTFHTLLARDPRAGDEVYVVDPETWERASENA